MGNAVARSAMTRQNSSIPLRALLLLFFLLLVRVFFFLRFETAAQYLFVAVDPTCVRGSTTASGMMDTVLNLGLNDDIVQVRHVRAQKMSRKFRDSTDRESSPLQPAARAPVGQLVL